MDMSPYKRFHRFSDFDSLDELIIIEDAETHESLYYNKAYEQFLEKVHKEELSFDSRFYSVNSCVGEVEGHTVVIEAAFAIKPQAEYTYDGHLRRVISSIEKEIREEMHNDFVVMSSSGKRKHGEIIDEVVRLTSNYYHAPYAQVALFDEGMGHTGGVKVYEGGKLIKYPTDVHIPAYWDNSTTNFFRHGASLLCEDMGGFDAFDHDLYTKFVERGIHTILMIPFFIEGEHRGFLLLANPRKNDHGIFDLFLGDFSANAIGTLIYRGLLYSSLYYDPLTRLPWINAGETRFSSYVNSCAGKPIAMMSLDIIHFRTISRSYGFARGDELLISVADVLRETFPDGIVCRQSGTDQFLVIGTGLADNMALEAQHVLFKIRAKYPDIMISMAFGIYQLSNRNEEFRVALLKLAFAHRVAKENPMQPIAIFDDAMAQTEEREKRLTDRFRKALEKGEFEIYIQPRYNLETGNFYSAEALIRWNYDGKVVSPGEFVPLFESNGLIHDLDLNVLSQVCALQARYIKEGKKEIVPISVNFSRADFADVNIFEKMAAVIDSYGIPTHLVDIEVTESAYVDFESQITSFIAKCHAIGVRVIMDDFGSGKSSYASLKNLDIDEIKLDYKFLGTSRSSRKQRKIIESIVTLARSIKLPIVIEGVENDDEVNFFRSLGVRYVQGYYFAKPMKVADFEALPNVKVETIENSFTDARLLFNELLDKESNSFFVFFNAPIAMGIYRFANNRLKPVSLNKALIDFASGLGVLNSFMRTDILSLLNESQRGPAIECLKGPREFYRFTDPEILDFRRNMSLHRFRISTMLIRESSEGRYYIVSGTPMLAPSSVGSIGISKEQFLSNIAFGNRNYALLDEGYQVFEYSDGVSKLFPDMKKGISIDDALHFQVPRELGVSKFYLLVGDSACEIEICPIQIDGKIAHACSFAMQADFGLHLAAVPNEGYGFYERALQSIGGIAEAFLQINLEDDTYFMVRLSDGQKAGRGVYSQGKYARGYLPELLAKAESNDRAMIQEKLSRSALLEGATTKKRFAIDFALEGLQRFVKVSVSFFFDKGRNYACLFFQDNTEFRRKDFDYLTGLMARNAGKFMMNRYIAEHPLSKMAFVIFDIDGFKVLNDTYGHPLGDKILAEIKAGLQTLPSQYQFFTRLGGDEFCLLLTDRGEEFDKAESRRLIEESLRNIGRKVGLEEDIRISTGYALIPESGITINDVYGAADSSLYRHKARKKGGKK